MPEWSTVALGEGCSKIGSGLTPRGGSSVYGSTGIAFIRSQNVRDLRFESSGLARLSEEVAAPLGHVAVRSGDVLLNITGDSVARCCVAPVGLDARVSQHVAILRPRFELIRPDFLAAFLVNSRTKALLLQIAGAGATRPALTKGQLTRLIVPSPPLLVQDAIGEIVAALGVKIQGNLLLVHELRALARELLLTAGRYDRLRVEDLATVRKGLSYTGAGLTDAGMPLVNLANAAEFGWLKRSGFKH